MTAPPPALVARRIGPGLEIRYRVLEDQEHGVRLAIGVAAAGHRVELPPIPAAFLESFLATVSWGVGEALAAHLESTHPATSAGLEPVTTAPAAPAITGETDDAQG